MDNAERIFSNLVSEYGEKLYWHVRGIVGSHDDANDVVQDVFAKAWRSISSFRGDSTAFTWLWKIATNEALNFLRRQRIRSFFSLDGSGADTVTGDPFFDGDEAERKLRKAIDALPAKQKTVFCMRYFEELPYEEISRITGTSEGALKATYHFAAEKIRESVQIAD